MIIILTLFIDNEDIVFMKRGRSDVMRGYCVIPRTRANYGESV